MENEKKNKKVTNGSSKNNTTKKVTKNSSSKSAPTKKQETKKATTKKVDNAKKTETAKKETAKKTTTKPNNTKTNNETKKTKAAKKATVKKVDKKVVNEPVKTIKEKEEKTTKEVEKTNAEKVEVIKKEKNIVKKEETKNVSNPETVISTKTWILTALCGLLIIVSIITFSLLNRFEEVEITDYYAYVDDNSLMLWDRENEKSIQLSTTFLTTPNKDFNYAAENYYKNDNDRIYFIDNVVEFAFDLNYVNVADLSKNERKAIRVAEKISSYDVKNGVVAYVKDNKLYIHGDEKEIIVNATSYKLSEDGKNLYYIDKDKKVFIYNLDTKTHTLVEENYNNPLYAIENDLYTVRNDGYIYKIYKNGELFQENVTDYGEALGEFVYYQYDKKLDKTFDELTKKYDESQITYDDIKKIISTKDRVLLFIGRPTCSYCTLLEEVFTNINKEKQFSYVYINTLFLSEEDLNKLLKFAGIDEKEFGTPTLVVTENGKLISSNVGYMEEEEATKYLEQNKIFTSKFTYDNGEKISFSPEVMFWASDTFVIENGKAKKMSDGALYLGSTAKSLDSDFRFSFVTSETNYENASASDLYYSLTLKTTNSKNNDSVDNKLFYSELQSLYIDSRNNYVLYQTQDDEKANFAKIKNGKLKNKTTIDSEKLCQITSTIRGTMFINNCNDLGLGDLSIWTGSKAKDVDNNVYQVFEGTQDYSYYVKYDENKKTYLLYSYKKKAELIDEVYYAIQPTSDVFYIKENVNVITGEDGKSNTDYSYELYIVNKDNKKVLIAENADTNFMAIPIK